MNEIERRERLLEWLGIIESQLQEIVLNHHVFVGTKNMVATNSRVSGMGSEFFRWMENNYIISQAVAVRRQADAGKDSISLRRFLLELLKSPELASRAHFVELHLGTPKRLAERSYDRLVGEGLDVLDSDQLQAEIAELTNRTARIKSLVDRKFAHTDKRGAGAAPKFSDLEDCIEFFEKMVKRYVLLLRAESLTALMPFFQYDWQEVFRHPWLEDQRPASEELKE